MPKRTLFTITTLLMLISVTSFSGTQPTKTEIMSNIGTNNFWTCYATDSDERTFPGLEKDRDAAQKTALEKCSFFSDSSNSCRLSQEDCEIGEL